MAVAISSLSHELRNETTEGRKERRVGEERAQKCAFLSEKEKCLFPLIRRTDEQYHISSGDNPNLTAIGAFDAPLAGRGGSSSSLSQAAGCVGCHWRTSPLCWPSFRPLRRD